MNRKALFAATILDNPYIPHDPTRRQAEFLLRDEGEVFYGGAAGGGKSDALLMAALQYAEFPNYAALLLRRTYADLSLPGALMDRAYDWLSPTDARPVDGGKSWQFPSGATLTFGYLEAERDKYRYQSSEFQFIGFDELTHFTEAQYTYLHSRLRRLEGSDIPIRMRSASNPGGVGHEWVKARFITGNLPFIPATLEDNPHIDQVAYMDALSKLDPVTREQLRHGNWDIGIKGELFDRTWMHITERPLTPGARRVRYWDLAATEQKGSNDPDWTVGLLLSTEQGRYCIEDVVRIRRNPGDVERIILQTAQLDGPGVAIRMEQEPGSSGKNTIDHYARSVLSGYDFRGVRNTGSKVERARPVSAAAANGNISVMGAPWAGDLLTELELFPQSGVHDDQVDALSGAFAELHTGGDASRFLHIVARRR